MRRLARVQHTLLGLAVIATLLPGGTAAMSATTTAPSPDSRIATARLITSRDVSRGVYEYLFTARQRRAIEVLLSDPEVNRIVQGWIASFEAYDPLTNDLDSVSVQGSTDMKVEGDLEKGFTVTAVGFQVI